MKEVLDVPAAVPADPDEADPEWCGRPVVHRLSRHGDVSETEYRRSGYIDKPTEWSL
jgi:hypothetical protein